MDATKDSGQTPYSTAPAELTLGPSKDLSRFRPNWPLLVFLGLQVLDFWTSLLVFANGGVELNFVVRLLMQWMGRGTALLISKVLLVVLVWPFRARRRLLIFADLLYFAIIAWNLLVLSSVR